MTRLPTGYQGPDVARFAPCPGIEAGGSDAGKITSGTGIEGEEVELRVVGKGGEVANLEDGAVAEGVAVAELMRRVQAACTEGLTVSGGEPLQQATAVVTLLEAARAAGLSTLLFTGLAWDEVQRLTLAPRIMACVDVLLAGRYVAARRVARGLLGSANKTVHLLSPRHTLRCSMHLLPQDAPASGRSRGR